MMRSLLERSHPPLVLLAIASLTFAYAYVIQRPGDNEKAHYALVRAISSGTPSIDDTIRRGGDLATIDVSTYRGHSYAAKAPGLALASVPPFLALRAAGANTTGDPRRPIWVLRLFGVVVPAAILVLLVYRRAESLAPGYGLAAAVTLGVSTLVLPFATLYFSHLLSAALGFAAFALLWGRARMRGVGIVACAGLLAGLAVSTEYPTAIVALVVGVYAAAGGDRVRNALAYAGGVLLGLVPVLAFDWWAFGSPFHLSYEGWHAPGARPLHGVFGITFPSLHTLLELLLFPGGVAPVVIPGLVATVLLYRRGARAEAVVIAAIAAGFLLYDSANSEPFGGASPGPRYLIPMLPFLSVPLALAYRSFAGATAGLAVGGAAFMVGATLTSPLAAWDNHVVHRLTTGGYIGSALELVGVTGAFALIPFLVALGVAGAAAVLATPEAVGLRFASAFVVTIAAWAAIATQSGRLLANRPAGELVAVAAVALASALIVVVYRARPRSIVPVGRGVAS